MTVAAADFVPAIRELGGHPRLQLVELDARDEADIDRRVADSAAVVSLLPASFHGGPARSCVKHARPLVTTSYVSDEIAALDTEAKRRGVPLLMECGFHPGLNHMVAMRVIDAARDEGAAILEYDSFAGGLPAPDSNDNPWGYKFSWSPAGVLAAALEPSTMLENGREIRIDGGEIFRRPLMLEIDPLGSLEAYPNRSALRYRDLYRIPEVRTMRRCTLRYPGHCATWDALIRLGLFDTSPLPAGLETCADLAGALGQPADNPRMALAARLDLEADAEPLKRLAWLGLFDDAPLPPGAQSPRDVLLALMTERLTFRDGERDVVLLHDLFEVETAAGQRERRHASLVDLGTPGGDSAMARMVGLPAAVAVELLLRREVNVSGVTIPVSRGVYAPILARLAELGVRLDGPS